MFENRFHYPHDHQKTSEDMLNFALDHVPYYRENWARYDIGREKPVDDRYAAMPILTKAAMRRYFPAGAVPDGMDIDTGLESDDIEYTFTSGTTGDKVVNLWHQPWWHAAEKDSWNLNSNLKRLKYPPKQATLASSLNVGISCEEDLPMSHRIMGNLLYLNEKQNIICWKKRHFLRMADELDQYKPSVIEANPSLLAKLAFWALDNGRSLYRPDVIISTYELPSVIHTETIRKAFGTPMVSSYGTTETGFVMNTCADGRYHQNTPWCRIEFLPLKKRYGGPDLGRIVVTTFGNPWACMLRFDVGDLVRLHKGHSCSCGIKTGFICDSVEGRVSNSTFAADGSLVTTAMADRALSKVPCVREYDLSQVDKCSYILSLEIRGDEKAAASAAKDALKELYGSDAHIEIRFSQHLLPGPAGKYRRTHTEFEFDEWSLTEGEYIIA